MNPAHFWAHRRDQLAWHSRQGSVRLVVLLGVFFCLGLAAGAFWYQHLAKRVSPDNGPELSGGTKSLLAQLTSPVEVRFYSLLDSSAPASLGSFAERVDRLLALYQQESNGKLQVSRLNVQTNGSANAALADGIKGFNLDKGDGCYLGLALTSNGKKETLAQLLPEWEPALESDLSRALARLNEANSGALRQIAPATDSAVAEELKRTVPNLDSLSLEEGTRTLREAALKEYGTAVGEMQAQVQEAQQHLAQARQGGSSAEQEAAIRNFQTVQSAQSEKLKAIAAKSQAQIALLQQIKAGRK